MSISYILCVKLGLLDIIKKSNLYEKVKIYYCYFCLDVLVLFFRFFFVKYFCYFFNDGLFNV